MATNEDIMQHYVSDDIGIIDRELLSEVMDLARADEAIAFQIWVRKNYSISKGKYRHRGDFYKNSALINESELYSIFKSQSKR